MKKEFSCKVYGYDKKEVDRYIEDLKRDYEEELEKKQDRMLELAEETRKLKLEVQEQSECLQRLSEQEKYVSQALIKAEQRAQSIIEEGRRKSAKEMEHMIAEKEKWRGKFRQVRQDLMNFEKSLLQMIERFRDDINHYSAQEISDTILVGEGETKENGIIINKNASLIKKEKEVSNKIMSASESSEKEKVIA